MSNLNIDGALQTLFTKLTGSSATEVYPKSGDTNKSQTLIASIVCCMNGAVTPNLTIAIDDGTNTYNLRRALAMTAGTAVIWDEPFTLPQNWTIKVTSSDASGQVDVLVNYLANVAAARMRPN